MMLPCSDYLLHHIKWLKGLVSYYSPDCATFERLIHEKIFSPAITTILVKPHRQLSLNNPRRLVDCDDDSDIGSYSYTYLSHSQGSERQIHSLPAFIPASQICLPKHSCEESVFIRSLGWSGILPLTR